jgi:hypothetical protein
MTKKAKTETSALVPIGEKSALPPALREKFAGFRKQQAASTPGPLGMPTVKAANGAFTFPGANTASETFRAVVLCALRANTFWEGRYVAGSEEPPVCMAMAGLGSHENSMAPTAGCAKPQSETCATCAQNVAPQKACRNGLHLALIHESQLKDVGKATIGRLRISSTGIAPFAGVVHYLSEQDVPLFGAVLEFRQEQAEGASYYTTFASPVAWTPTGVLEALAERVKEGADELTRAAQPIPQADGGGGAGLAPPQLPPRRKVSRKARRKL